MLLVGIAAFCIAIGVLRHDETSTDDSSEVSNLASTTLMLICTLGPGLLAKELFARLVPVEQLAKNRRRLRRAIAQAEAVQREATPPFLDCGVAYWRSDAESGFATRRAQNDTIPGALRHSPHHRHHKSASPRVALRPGPSLLSNVHEHLLRLLREYVLWCCEHETPPRVSEFARRQHLSRTDVPRLIRAASGVDASTYMRRVQVDIAKQLLLTGLTTQQVAYRSGFGTRRSFFRVFTRLVGVTPAAFRKSARAGRP